MNYIIPPLPNDRVVSFGYKCSWIAVRTTDMGAVIDTLGLGDPHPCSWEDGIAQGYNADSGRVFVTPPLKGYVLCVSFSLPEFPTGGRPDEITPVIERLAKRFDDVQYFFSYRVVDAHAWARFSGGKRVRAFAVADGEQSWDIGTRTDAEAELDLEYPDESDVMKVAGHWSVNPTKLDAMNLEVTQGVIGSFKSPHRNELP